MDVRYGGTRIDCTEVRHVLQVLPHGERAYVWQHRETQFHTTSEAFIHRTHTVPAPVAFCDVHVLGFAARRRSEGVGAATGPED